MNDCITCPVEKECHYPFKPCDCVLQRKFMSEERRKEYDAKMDATISRNREREKEQEKYTKDLEIAQKMDAQEEMLND